MLGIIKRNFIYLTPHSFVILYKGRFALTRIIRANCSHE